MYVAYSIENEYLNISEIKTYYNPTHEIFDIINSSCILHSNVIHSNVLNTISYMGIQVSWGMLWG